MDKITKREMKFFLIGVLSVLLIQFLWNFQEHASDFKSVFNDGYNSAR